MLHYLQIIAVAVISMKRNAISDLINWKNSADRKPLVMRGARQVGKTWLMREFGQSCYSSFVYFNFDEEDEEYEKCREFVIQAQKASTSLLQRKFRIGYNKAARIIDRLEEEGVIGPQLGSKPREVYIRQYHEEDL